MNEVVQEFKRLVKRKTANFDIADWSEKNIVIPESQPLPGVWRNRVPASLPILDALADDTVRVVCVRAGVQMMKTALLVNYFLWTVDNAPGETLFYEPTDDLAKTFADKRLSPVAQNIESMRQFFKTTKKSMERSFPGGSVKIMSGGSTSATLMHSARYVLVDEWRSMTLDLMTGLEGRQTLYEDIGAKMLVVSSAGESGTCRITELFESSDRGYWNIRCPVCRHLQRPEWRNVRWRKSDGSDAVYVCTGCHGRLGDHLLQKANRSGEYIFEEDRNMVAGFHANSLANPFITLSTLARQWLNANRALKTKGDEFRVKNFVQDRLAIPYESSMGALDAKQVQDLCSLDYPKNELPQWVTVLIVSVDVQDNRLEYEISGWGLKQVQVKADATEVRVGRWKYNALELDGKFYQLRRCGVRYGRIPGDPGTGEVWQALEDIRDHVEKVRGLKIRPVLMLIDSGGHYTDAVKTYTRISAADMRAGRSKGLALVLPVKGANRTGEPLVRASQGKTVLRDYGCELLFVGTDGAKDVIASALRSSRFVRDGSKKMIWPRNRANAGYGDQYFKSLLSERRTYQVNKNTGRNRYQWVKAPGVPNEALDLAVYSFAGVYYLGIARIFEIRKIQDNMIRV